MGNDDVTKPVSALSPEEEALLKLKEAEQQREVLRKMPEAQSTQDWLQDLQKRQQMNYEKQLVEQAKPKIPSRPSFLESAPKDSGPWIDSEGARDIDLGKYHAERAAERQASLESLKKQLALEKLSKATSIGTKAFGAGMIGRDLYKGDIPEAAITAAQLAGGTAAIPLDIFRSTPTASEEQEMQEMEKFRNINNILAKKQKSSRDLASE